MPRQPRVTSGTDIYHVMLRGINRQDIFEDKEDYVRFLLCMQQMLEPYDDLGNRLPPLCTFYAYCLMSNHVHLLIKTHHEDIGATIKHLAVVYAIYFNHGSRNHPLIQFRSPSRPRQGLNHKEACAPHTYPFINMLFRTAITVQHSVWAVLADKMYLSR